MTETMTKKAQLRVKSGENSPNWRVDVGNRRRERGDTSLSKRFSATISYQAQGGTSDLKLSVDEQLASYQNAPVSVSVGYGPDLRKYFEGTMADPVDTVQGSSADGWGPFKLMSEQILGEQVSYVGWTLERAFYDLILRAGYPAGSVEVVSGRAFLLTGEVTFTMETKLSDVANALAEKAGYVFCDRPNGTRLIMPRPRPSLSSEYAFHYTPSHYGPDGFIAQNSRRGFYSRVLIFQRREDGTNAWQPVDIPIQNSTRYRPPRWRAYVVPEFVGSREDAVAEGVRLSEVLAAGSVKCSLGPVSANPDVALYDGMSAERYERRDEGGRTPDPYLVSYGWMNDESVQLELTRESHSMTFVGEGVPLSAKKLPKPFYFQPTTSPVVRRFEEGGFTYNDLSIYTYNDLSDTTYEEL